MSAMARPSPPLTFGTAGLRGPMRDGPDGMNVETVTRASWALAKVLKDRRLAGSTVVVGRDARHQSDDFAIATAEVLAAEGFSVMLLPDAAPTPVVAFAVRHLRAAAGVQITASHNPPADNGYKVYLDGGMQIVPPTDRDIEAAMMAAPSAAQPRGGKPGGHRSDARIRPPRGKRATDDGRRAGGTDPHARRRRRGRAARAARGGHHRRAHRRGAVRSRPRLPHRRLPESGGTGRHRPPTRPGRRRSTPTSRSHSTPTPTGAPLAIPTPTGWRMLSGDETGWLLGDYVLSHTEPGNAMATSVVASTVVSSRMLASIAASHGARHVETLTGFKWLARADSESPGATLVYAYEEAIGHCVDPAAVRDKDGITAAVLVCDLVVALQREGRTLLDALDALALTHGVHATAAVSVPAHDGVMTRLRAAPPSRVGGEPVEVTDLLDRRGQKRTDAVIYTGARCESRSDRRAPSRRSRRTSRFDCHRATTSGQLAPQRPDCWTRSGPRWSSYFSADRTDGLLRRRDPARCRRRR